MGQLCSKAPHGKKNAGGGKAAAPKKAASPKKAAVPPPSPAWSGQLTLKTLTSETVVVEDCSSSMSLADFKRKLAALSNTQETSAIRLVIDGKELEGDAKTLSQLRVTPKSFIVILFRLTDADRQEIEDMNQQ